MNRHNVPWIREWEEQVERDARSFTQAVLVIVAFVLLSLLFGYVLADGLDREARVAQVRAEAARQARLELLQRVDREVDREGKTWTAFYRAASKPGLSGFDGVVLVENRQ